MKSLRKRLFSANATKEILLFFSFTWKHFRSVCLFWPDEALRLCTMVTGALVKNAVVALNTQIIYQANCRDRISDSAVSHSVANDHWPEASSSVSEALARADGNGILLNMLFPLQRVYKDGGWWIGLGIVRFFRYQ